MASRTNVSLVRKFLSVRGIPTCLLKAGEVHESDTKAGKSLFLIIPGNPGVIDFYDEFQKILHSASESAIPVWGVAHAGHMEVPKDMTPKAGDLYELEDQINHKIAFIEDHIPANTRLVLIGHSIGCYIILEILRRKPNLPIQKGILLFPTIERMAQTPNGVVSKPLALNFRWAAYLAASLAYYLPDCIKLFLIRLHLRGSTMNPTAALSACHLFNPDCLNNLIFMGGQEMQQVNEPDTSTIKENLSKLIFYYGQTDKWCPVEFYEEMKNRFPDGRIVMDDRGMSHAFCLRASREMAELIWEWTRKDL
ncbi:lipid droplet-associated hydrolase-like isoform X2 [Apostichopus japonicus]|uniref:lipid droplet-associated hydrolase-like isoform X2 n=1 Tax=Stichopus japonicus TaxID=307972 RepID=UPI003AB6C6FB